MTTHMERLRTVLAKADRLESSGAMVQTEDLRALLTGTDLVLVPREPTEAQWGGLARAIMMWLDMTPHTPRALFRHLECSGIEVPEWLRNEPEMDRLDHVPSKGTRCVLIYRAMLAGATR